MNMFDNLNDAKDLAIGEHFIFGKYQGELIVWQKIDEHLAISEKILDCIVFNDKLNNKYSESAMRKWCNNVLSKSLRLIDDTVYALTKENYKHYFPTDESRQAKPTEWAIMHGIYVDDDGNSPYWTISPESNYYNTVHYVNSFGSFSYSTTNNSDFGVRPALKI